MSPGHRLHEAQALATLSRATTGEESVEARTRAETLLTDCGAAPTAVTYVEVLTNRL